MSTPARDIPARGGVGLKAEHYRSVLAEPPDLGFFEIHAENYMGAGGPPHRYLSAIRDLYPLSLHGVGLSIGGPGRLDTGHLMRLKALIARYQPGLFSEHLAWSTHETGYLSDLLPLPYTAATLQTVCNHIDETQSVLGRPMLLENPSSYLRFAESSFDEAGFIAEVVRRTGCGLLLDVNNVFVSARNLATDATDYLAAYPLSHVQEIHLAGHDVVAEDGGAVLIDSHAAPVVEDVWQLYAAVIGKTGPLPTLIERDANVPPLAELVAEAGQAEHIMRTLFAGRGMIGQREFAAAIGDWSLLPADPRFRIYRANVTSALINALRVRYPVTERLLGREDFAACAGSYAETQRPTSPVLIDYGASFPDYLAAVSHDACAADLARLESLWWQAYHAIDASPLPPEKLSEIPPESWGQARFAFLPSLGLMSSPHAVGSLWQGQHGASGPQNVVVARPEADVTLHLLGPAPFALLARLCHGNTLAEAVETTSGIHADFDLTQSLQGLLALRIITGVST